LNTPPRGTGRRLGRTLGLGLTAMVGLYAAARLVVLLPPVERAARDRIALALKPRLGDVAIGPEIRFDALFRPTFGPVIVPGAARGLPILTVRTVRVRPSATALLLGRLEPASVLLEGVRFSVGPHARDLQALLEGERRPAHAGSASQPSSASRAPPALPALHVRDAIVVVPIRGRAVELGPFDADLDAERDPAATRARLVIRLATGARIVASASSDGRRWHLHARLRGVGPNSTPDALRDLPARLESGELRAELDADAPADLSRAEASVRVTGDDVRVAGERIAESPLGPFRASAAGTLSWEAAERRLSFRDGVIAVADAVHVDVSGEARLGAGIPFRVALWAHGVDYAALVEALPPTIRPPDEAPRPYGTLDARLDAAGPLLAPAAWSLSAALDLSRMRAASRGLPGNPLRAPFLHTPDLPGARAFEVGPRNPDFVPVDDLPPYVVRAVTASEDAGFFAHHGFDFAELADAFTAGAERGRVVRGGSTITQQLAKNLYLSSERTIARKIREAAITIALEATVPKARLLEIYLNVAEWGPGVFGIGAAARHWFGKDARALTPKEAAFLASVIPNPVRYDGMRARGAPSAAWEQRVQEILLRMSNQGALGPDELLRALAEPLVFAHG